MLTHFSVIMLKLISVQSHECNHSQLGDMGTRCNEYEQMPYWEFISLCEVRLPIFCTMLYTMTFCVLWSCSHLPSASWPYAPLLLGLLLILLIPLPILSDDLLNSFLSSFAGL